MSGVACRWAMVDVRTGSPSRKAVLAALGDIANAQGAIHAVRLRVICERSEVSVSTAQRAIAHFENLGILVRSPRPGRGAGFQLNLEYKTPVTVTGVEKAKSEDDTPVTVTDDPGHHDTPVTVTGPEEEPRSPRPDTPVTVTGPTTLEHGLVTGKTISSTDGVVVAGDAVVMGEYELGWEAWVLGELRKVLRVSTTAGAKLRAWMAESGEEWHQLQPPVEAVVRGLGESKLPEMMPRCRSVEDFIDNYDRIVDWANRRGRCRNQHAAGNEASREEELRKQVAEW